MQVQEWCQRSGGSNSGPLGLQVLPLSLSTWVQSGAMQQPVHKGSTTPQLGPPNYHQLNQESLSPLLYRLQLLKIRHRPVLLLLLCTHTHSHSQRLCLPGAQKNWMGDGGSRRVENSNDPKIKGQTTNPDGGGERANRFHQFNTKPLFLVLSCLLLHAIKERI